MKNVLIHGESLSTYTFLLLDLPKSCTKLPDDNEVFQLKHAKLTQVFVNICRLGVRKWIIR